MRCVNGKINSSYGLMPSCTFACAVSHGCEVKLDIPVSKMEAFKKRFVYPIIRSVTVEGYQK